MKRWGPLLAMVAACSSPAPTDEGAVASAARPVPVPEGLRVEVTVTEWTRLDASLRAALIARLDVPLVARPGAFVAVVDEGAWAVALPARSPSPRGPHWSVHEGLAVVASSPAMHARTEAYLRQRAPRAERDEVAQRGAIPRRYLQSLFGAELAAPGLEVLFAASAAPASLREPDDRTWTLEPTPTGLRLSTPLTGAAAPPVRINDWAALPEDVLLVVEASEPGGALALPTVAPLGPRRRVALRCSGLGLTALAEGDVEPGQQAQVQASMAAWATSTAFEGVEVRHRQRRLNRVPFQVHRLRFSAPEREPVDMLFGADAKRWSLAVGAETVSTMQRLTKPDQERRLGLEPSWRAALDRLPRQVRAAAVFDYEGVRRCLRGEANDGSRAPSVSWWADADTVRVELASPWVASRLQPPAKEPPAER